MFSLSRKNKKLPGKINELNNKIDSVIERLNMNDHTIQSLLETQKKTDDIIERLNMNDRTIQSLLETQKKTDDIIERLNMNDRTIQSLLETQKKTDDIIEKLNMNDRTIQSLLETQKKTDDIIERLNMNDRTIQSLLETQKKTDDIIERLNMNDITIQSLIDSAKKLDQHLFDYKDTQFKLISRTEKLADKIFDIEGIDNMSELEENFWNEGKFIMLDKKTYSQTGEDSIIAHIVANLRIPFSECNYLDLGANNPKEMSNTYFFYSMGASGVLVEANPNLSRKLKAVRSRDIVLNNCISDESGKFLPFNVMNIDGLSALGDVSDVLEKNPDAKIERVIDVESISVNDIIAKYFPSAPVILNIDIEGMEMAVFSSIDFEKFRPLIIICEMIPYDSKLVINEKNKEILKFMDSKGYTEYAFTGINSIFIDKASKFIDER